ncbi:hypothetical protein AALP_AAs60001U000200 [Arabis alpina]|uniref:Uncharacterized protein n=1 Tax=Arabis alpina TaxID=50452 RepID=A0A087FZI3_ARAAL|nr:hypothetical protein AALP_AAs60001U000200 [Arabis alpina]
MEVQPVDLVGTEDMVVPATKEGLIPLQSSSPEQTPLQSSSPGQAPSDLELRSREKASSELHNEHQKPWWLS